MDDRYGKAKLMVGLGYVKLAEVSQGASQEAAFLHRFLFQAPAFKFLPWVPALVSPTDELFPGSAI